MSAGTKAAHALIEPLRCNRACTDAPAAAAGAGAACVLEANGDHLEIAEVVRVAAWAPLHEAVAVHLGELLRRDARAPV